MASATYREFLSHPSTSLLADRAALHYVTTTTSFLGAADVVKHLTALQKQVKKKRQAVLNLIDGDTVVAFEVETELEFLTSGGVYLPGLDDNFLSDRIAHLPIMHIVTFDRQGKILQIRQQWDQGSLLKQLEIIGKTGRNWPIKDNRDQLSMIRNCLEQVGLASPATQGSNNVARARGSSSNALRDPHASLELFAPREQIESAKPSTVVSPYAGNRPRQCDFAEILGDEAHASRERSMSPGKRGQGKNFQPMRIFEGSEHNEDNDDDDGSENQSRKSHIRPDPCKYDHFDFVDGSDPQDNSRPGTTTKERPKSKHNSQWSFDDFVTPQRPKPSKTYRHQDVSNWNVEPGNNEEAGKPAAGKGRRDAENHFELQDDGELVPRQERPGVKPRGATHNEGLGLYKNNLNREDATPGPKRALGNITNLKDRTKDFDAHFAMVDDSPAAEPSRAPQVPEGRLKAVKMMDANWASYDQSPAAQKENKPRSGQAKDDIKIHIAGDGMEAKKGNNRDWQHGGGPEKEGIHIAGDGMGGKKGTNRNWLFGGDDEDATTSAPGAAKAPTARKGNASAAQKSFWDF